MSPGQLYQRNFFEWPATTKTRRKALKAALANPQSAKTIWKDLCKNPKDTGLLDCDDLVQLIKAQQPNGDFWRTAFSVINTVLETYAPEERIARGNKLARDLNLRAQFDEMIKAGGTFKLPVEADKGIYKGVYFEDPTGFASFVNKLEKSSIVAFLQKQFWLEGQHCFHLLPILAEKFESKELQKLLQKEFFPRKESILSKAARHIETCCSSSAETPEIMEVLKQDRLRGVLDLPANVILKVVEKYDSDTEFCKSMTSRSDFSQKIDKFLNSSAVTKEQESRVRSQPYFRESLEVYRASQTKVRAQVIKSKLQDNPSQAQCALVAENDHDLEQLIPVKKKSWTISSLFSSFISLFYTPSPQAIAHQNKLDEAAKLQLAQKSPYFASKLYKKTLPQLALDEKPVQGLGSVYKDGLYGKDGFVLLQDTLERANQEDTIAFINKYFKVKLDTGEVKAVDSNGPSQNNPPRLMNEFALRQKLFNKILGLSNEQLKEIPQFVDDFVAAVFRLKREALLTPDIRARLLHFAPNSQKLLLPKEPLIKDMSTQVEIKMAHAETEIGFRGQSTATQVTPIKRAATAVQVEIKNETSEMATQIGGERNEKQIQTEVTEKDLDAMIDMKKVSMETAIKMYVADYDADNEVKNWRANPERTQRLEQLVKINKNYIPKFIAALQKQLAEPQQVREFIVANFTALEDPNALDRLDHVNVNILLGSSQQLISSLLARITELEQQLANSKLSQNEVLESKTHKPNAEIELNKLRAAFAACYLRTKNEKIPIHLKDNWDQLREVSFGYISKIFADLSEKNRRQMLSSWGEKNLKVVHEIMTNFPVFLTPYKDVESLVQYIMTAKPSPLIDPVEEKSEAVVVADSTVIADVADPKSLAELPISQGALTRFVENTKNAQSDIPVVTRNSIYVKLEPLFNSPDLLANIINELRGQKQKAFVEIIHNLFDGEKDIQDLDALDKMLIDVVVPASVDSVPDFFAVLQKEIDEGNAQVAVLQNEIKTAKDSQSQVRLHKKVVETNARIQKLKVFFDKIYRATQQRQMVHQVKGEQLDILEGIPEWNTVCEYHSSQILEVSPDIADAIHKYSSNSEGDSESAADSINDKSSVKSALSYKHNDPEHTDQRRTSAGSYQHADTARRDSAASYQHADNSNGRNSTASFVHKDEADKTPGSPNSAASYNPTQNQNITQDVGRVSTLSAASFEHAAENKNGVTQSPSSAVSYTHNQNTKPVSERVSNGSAVGKENSTFKQPILNSPVSPALFNKKFDQARFSVMALPGSSPLVTNKDRKRRQVKTTTDTSVLQARQSHANVKLKDDNSSLSQQNIEHSLRY